MGIANAWNHVIAAVVQPGVEEKMLDVKNMIENEQNL